MARRTEDPLEEVERVIALEEEAESRTALNGLAWPQTAALVLVTTLLVAVLLWYFAG